MVSIFIEKEVIKRAGYWTSPREYGKADEILKN